MANGIILSSLKSSDQVICGKTLREHYTIALLPSVREPALAARLSSQAVEKSEVASPDRIEQLMYEHA
jgi:hypothetical protein